MPVIAALRYTFQAGHEGSIPFARSTTKRQVKAAVDAGMMQDQEASERPRARCVPDACRSACLLFGGRMHDLDTVIDLPHWMADGQPEALRATSLRWVYQHMIEAYARHNGHADLLRQGMGGAVGDRWRLPR
jgi:hypothetical protein